MTKLRIALSLLTSLSLVGCGDDDTVDPPDTGTLEASVGEPLTLTESRVCALDGDCGGGQVCFQSVCSMASAPAVDAVPGLSIKTLPKRIARIMAGQQTHQIAFELSAAPPSEGLAYRIERTDLPDAMPEVRFAQGGATLQIDIPTGASDPDHPEAGNPVFINLVTAAGTIRQILTPALSAAGTYGGQVTMETFGQTALPLEFSVVTEPVGASLVDATAAYLVLPVEDGHLWNPIPFVEDGPTHVTRELVFDRFVQAWVARFEMPYALPESSAFSWVTHGGEKIVNRNLRFEVTDNGSGGMDGRLSDSWSGLSDSRTLAGVLQSEVIAFAGTFETQRMGAAPLLSEVPVETYDVPAIGLLPDAVIDACDSADFGVSATIDGQLRDCTMTPDVASFLTGSPADQASCALAMADVALSQDTTASQIVDFLDDDTPNPGGQSFTDFMDDCVRQQNGRCVPSEGILCSRQLAATSIKYAMPGATSLPLLLRAYQDATREAFLGKGFAAFFADSQTRLDWLKAQDYPAIVTAAVQSFIADLLDEWQRSVLDVHMSVLRGHFDGSAGSALGQELTGLDEALTRQRGLLLEVTQAWRASADAMTVGATRWNTLLTDPRDRVEKTTYLHNNMLDLYIMAGALAELNRTAGAGANNAVFGGGFRALLQETRQLSFPFDQLIYERQGEVVVSSSLDPMAGNETILATLQAATMAEVAEASTAVNGVIADSEAELLNEADLTARIANEAGDLEAQLVEICGLPDGCDRPDEASCAPQVQAGKCGFVVDTSGNVLDRFPSDANPSAAGASILEVESALLSLRRAEEAVRSHAAGTELYANTTQAFSVQVNSWNTQRLALVSSVETQIGQIQGSSDAALAEMAQNMTAQMARRKERLAEQQETVDAWQQITLDGVRTDLQTRTRVNSVRAAAAGMKLISSQIDSKAKAAAEGFPRSAGFSVDATAPARSAVLMAAIFVSGALKVGAVAAESSASYMETNLMEAQALRNTRLQVLQFDDEVKANTSEADVEFLRNQFRLIENASEAEREIALAMIDNLERDTEAALAYERDLVELRDRQVEVLARIIEDEELHIQVEQAELTVRQATLEYGRSVLSAQLLAGRLSSVRNQLQNVNQLLGSPASVFAWANSLTIAESRLERAKASMMDWVVALEYFAVRPFFDSRIQVVLARNTTQLEKIAADLQRIQSSCGGAVNNQVVEVSVRKNLLGINRPVTNLETGEALSPEERFRELLAVGRIPIDKRVRYSTDASVGDLLNRGGVLAVSFDIGMNEFANLETTCNAKIQSIAVQLVGEGLGDALPTVSVLYDGTSRLRSCQPDIEAIVRNLGPDATPFDKVTQFSTPGRSVSPVAGINAFPEEGNQTLAGLPISSQYTLLIDREAGENGSIDWSKLEDVQLRFTYGYQDLFPSGQCQ